MARRRYAKEVESRAEVVQIEADSWNGVAFSERFENTSLVSMRCLLENGLGERAKLGVRAGEVGVAKS